jgi:hypothetical protein
MGNATESALSGSSPASRPGFTDGLGERVIVPGSLPGERLEILQLRPELTTVSSFEFALRERAARLANFHHESYARVRQIDRVRTPVDRLAVVCDYVEGWRLSDILATTRDRHLELDINAALSLIGQLVHAVAILHQHARGVAHGSLAPERIVVTAGARVVVVEYVLGAALERLELTRERLWRELRVAAPPSAGSARFDHRTDVTQIGAVALALLLGRPLGGDEYPQRVADLLANAQENRTLGGRQLLSKPLRAWLARALQLDFRNSFQSAMEAKAALETLLAEERGYAAAPVALESFLGAYQRTAATVRVEDADAPLAHEPAHAVREIPARTTAAAPAVGVPLALSESISDSGPAPGAAFDVASFLAPAAAAAKEREPATAGRPAAPAPQPATETPVASTSATAAMPADVEELRSLDLPPLGLTGGSEQGYPGAFESMFGTDAIGAEGLDDEDEPEEMEAIDAAGGGRRRTLLRIGLCLAALLVLAAAGYFGLGLLWGTEPPATGTLNVESQPAGLPVKIDGKPRGNTPLKVALESGPHRLELETGGEPRVIPITMTPGGQMSQYIEAPPAPITGRLQITSEPPGAIVFVDGERKGAAPILVAGLGAGRHKVDLQADGATVQQEVTIEAGVTSSVIVPMSKPSGPVSGWLSVSSPVELEVYEDGKLLGTSQSDRLLMTAGKHDLELVNETLGFRGQQTAQVVGGKTATLRVQLPNGVLSVNAVPWAEVWIDGARVGETPIGNLALPIGPHEVVFRHPQLSEQRHAVTVTTKAAARVSVDLRK